MDRTFECIIVLMSLIVISSEVTTTHRDYIIVGAGPSGIQMAYFLEKANRDYVIVERNSIPGSFFELYPRHNKLISINKRYTGQRNSELNFRHDWNGLISDLPQLKFKHYSRSFFPDKSEMRTYLKDYVTLHNIKVVYDTNVEGLRNVFDDKKMKFTMKDKLGNIFTCKYLILATGVDIPNKLDIPGSEFITDYSKASVDADDYINKRVLIIGNGNSAFEFADGIVSTASYVHILGRNKIELAWATHYVGDLRAVNNGLLDTYQLKSLDGVLEGDIDTGRIVKQPNGKLKLEPGDVIEDNYSLRHPYDVIIGCIGFSYNHSIYEHLKTNRRKSRKYPSLTPDHKLGDDLYVIGTASHGLDFKKSAGAFVHGFRYTTKIVHRTLEWKHHGVPWPSKTMPLSSLLSKITIRLNSMSANYQMTKLIVDVILLNSDDKTFTYLEELSSRTLASLNSHTGHQGKRVMVVRLEYGTAAVTDVFGDDRATGDPEDAHNSNFLHPVIYYYADINKVIEKFDNPGLKMPRPQHLLHLVEDFHAQFFSPLSHQQVLRGFISLILNKDNRMFYAEECALFSLTMTMLPLYCEEIMRLDVQPVSNNNDNSLFSR